MRYNKEVMKLASSYGFKLLRSRKHMIFKHESGARLVTGASISDRRALKNIESNIKKLLSNNDSTANKH